MTLTGKTAPNDRRILHMLPTFTSPPRMVISRLSSIVAASPAPRVMAYTGNRPYHVLTHTHHFHSRLKIAEFEDFFYSRYGAAEAFWVPSWHAELNPTASVANGATTINVTPVGYSTYYLTSDSSQLGRYMFLHSIDGKVHIVQVDSVAVVGDDERITFTPATESEFTLGKFYAGFLYLVRFTSDTLSMEFSGLSAARCEVPMIQVTGTSEATGTDTGDIDLTELPDPSDTVITDPTTELPFIQSHSGATYYESKYLWTYTTDPTTLTGDQVTCIKNTLIAELADAGITVSAVGEFFWYKTTPGPAFQWSAAWKTDTSGTCGTVDAGSPGGPPQGAVFTGGYLTMALSYSTIP